MQLRTTMYLHRAVLLLLVAAVVAVPAFRIGYEQGKKDEAANHITVGNPKDCAAKVLNRLIDRAETENDRIVLASFVNETCEIADRNKTLF